MDMIRPYRSSDVLACLDIFDGNTPRFFAPVERAEFEHFLAGYAVAWDYQVIERNSRLVACGGHAINKDAKSADFCWGMVINKLDGTGLGKMLTWARLKAASEVPGIETVRLDTSQHTQGFYAQFGFVPDRIIPKGMGPDSTSGKWFLT
ncbi:GNAT family N-acetyltransferase [Massilia atriviolacea]|uniref:GNAT family N-acetyltransferase n=1 Tax=Massilia atriviolacea TaxID=2495579 RepID=UPI0018E0A416|nr:GNAT family N-acetyltransferase [Massilia atriviolacea]